MASRSRPSHPIRRATPPLAAVVVLGLAVAACGGGSSSSTTTTKPKGGTATTTTAPASKATTTAPAATTTVPTTATAPTTATTPATTVPASTTTAGPTLCATAALTLSISGASGAAGSTYESLDLQNTGSVTCTLNGYPGVSYVTGSSGSQVGAPAARDTSSTPTLVTLAPGATASAQLRLIDPYNFDQSTCQITPVLGFRVYPPGQTTAGFVAAAGNACASTSVQGLYVGAVEAG
jgi:hypothetical protein